MGLELYMKVSHIMIAFAMLATAVAGGTTPTYGAEAPKMTDPDSKAIRTAALDYIDGFYTGDADRMERAVHPELAKRIVMTDATSGKNRLDQMSAMTLVQVTRAGGGKSVPVERRQEDVSILDRFQNVATVKIVATNWVDYLQMAKFNGDWKIINVLWELKARTGEKKK
jgi:hypothetical protein